MGVLDLAEGLSEAEMQALVDGIFRGQVSEEREERIREAIAESDPTLREDAVELNPAFDDLERVLGLEPSEPPGGPLPGEAEPEAEPAIRERTQAEREARQRVIDLIEANMDDVEVLLDIARALEQREAALSGLFAQERIETLSEMDLSELAERARRTARTAEPLEVGDFPDLERALRRGGGRDVTYFENIIAELEGERDVQTLANQGVSAEQVEQLREENPSVIDAAIDRAQSAIRGLEGRGREPERAATPTEAPAIEPGGQGVSAAVRRVVPQQPRREDPLTGETWTADVELENRFYAWALGVKPQNRWSAFDFRTRPVNRDISMEQWARLQVKAGNGSVTSARDAGLPEDWFDDL